MSENQASGEALLILCSLQSIWVSNMFRRDMLWGGVDRPPLWRTPGLDAQRIICLLSVMVFPQPLERSGVSV